MHDTVKDQWSYKEISRTKRHYGSAHINGEKYNKKEVGNQSRMKG
jgi:hypothetical protein